MTIKTKNNISNNFKIMMIILAIISALTSCWVIYQLVTIKKPWTLGVTYASKLTANDSQQPICKVNIKSNKNNNGQNIYEFQFNSYTDTEGNGIAGFGIQSVGDYSLTKVDGIDLVTELNAGNIFLGGYNNLLKGDFYYYYTGDEGVTYMQIDPNFIDDYLLIDINGEFYRLTLKEYDYTHQVAPNFWEFQYLFSPKYETERLQYTWYHVFDYIVQSALTNTGQEEYQEFPLSLLDCSEFLKVEYKDNKGQYHELENTSETRNYLTIQVTFDKNGATDFTDSQFKQVAGSTTWDYYDDTNAQDYWTDYTHITLTEDHMNLSRGQNSGLKCITIDQSFAEYLNSLTHAVIKIRIDLDNFDEEIYGIFMDNFTFKIDSFQITADKKQEFYIFNETDTDIVPELIWGV